MTEAFGCKLDPYDPRDYLASAFLAPTAGITRKFYTMVNKDFRIQQGSEGTCVGHGHTNILLAGPTEHDTYPPFKTEELAHQFARKLYFETSGDATYKLGTYPRDACAKLLEWGLIDSYWSLAQVDEVVAALLTHGPVGISVPWYSSLSYNDGRLSKQFGNFWCKVNLESGFNSYHWVALTGVDTDPADGAPPYVRLQNSWGGWGQNGTARLTIEGFRRLNRYSNWTFKEKAF